MPCLYLIVLLFTIKLIMRGGFLDHLFTLLVCGQLHTPCVLSQLNVSVPNTNFGLIVPGRESHLSHFDFVCQL